MAVLIHRTGEGGNGDNSELRQNITRRLMSIMAERRRLEGRIGVLTEIEKELRALLDAERQQPLPMSRPLRQDTSPVVPDASSPPSVHESTDIKALIRQQLLIGPKRIDELLDWAEAHRIGFAQKSPRRVMHFHLINLKNSGLVEKPNTGIEWRLTERGKQLAQLERIQDT